MNPGKKENLELLALMGVVMSNQASSEEDWLYKNHYSELGYPFELAGAKFSPPKRRGTNQTPPKKKRKR